ncbi:hypothetical protein AVEN_231226-1 [Araneus ventricosus]|uniref:Uncharacterized protein n=1 Tax=Araneus ventricosus TaxID=182803 RepID=A0A4Y2TGU2_ARAVE|nr:hypothetical protein AVEN_231226-1 [Araneus ventricosus]
MYGLESTRMDVEDFGVKTPPRSTYYPYGLESTRMDVENSGVVLTTPRPPTHQSNPRGWTFENSGVVAHDPRHRYPIRFESQGWAFELWCGAHDPVQTHQTVLESTGWTLKTWCNVLTTPRPPRLIYGFRIHEDETLKTHMCGAHDPPTDSSIQVLESQDGRWEDLV